MECRLPVNSIHWNEQQGEIRKVLISEQCKNYWKTTELQSIDFFKKIGDTRGTCHANLGTIKDRKLNDLTEADRLRRGSKNAQKNYTKMVIMSGIGKMLGSLTSSQIYQSMKSSGPQEASLQAKLGKVMEFHLSCLKILQNELVKVLHSICQQIQKTPPWPQCWKRSIFISIQKKGNFKECSTYHSIVLISLASKVMLKILQAKFLQYMN